ncbi:unnamed protein product [Peronospora effusa]|nr:unnamed protein product [Peronospora effusa]
MQISTHQTAWHTAAGFIAYLPAGDHSGSYEAPANDRSRSAFPPTRSSRAVATRRHTPRSSKRQDHFNYRQIHHSGESERVVDAEHLLVSTGDLTHLQSLEIATRVRLDLVDPLGVQSISP